MTEKKSAKILRFERNAEYYYRRFEQFADNYQYFDALVNIRMALQKDPDNQDYQLSMAEILTEMGNYEDSNALLFPLFYQKCEFPADVLFNLGCNFYGLHDNEKAKQCFSQYLTEYPDDEFIYDASDMLEVMEAEDSAEQPLTPVENDLADEGKYLIGICDFEGAIRVLKKIVEQGGDVLFAENNLALANFCNGDVDEAIRIAGSVLKKDPQNLHAICNLALFYHEKGIANPQNLYLSRMQSLTPADSDETLKLLLTYCELGVHKKVTSMMKTTLQEKPYDARVLYLAAISSANVGDYADALVHLENMLRLDPYDSIARYYKKQVEEAAKGAELPVLEYNYQVPTDEIRRRLDYLNKCIQLADDALLSLWQQESGEMKSIVLWGIYLNDPNIKRLCLEIVNAVGDREAIRILQRYLLKESEPNEVKHDIFIMLSMHNVPLPYIAYLNGKIAEVNMRPSQSAEPLQCHLDVLNYIAATDRIPCDIMLIKECTDILEHYLMSCKKPPVMRNIEVWAAALIYSAYTLYPNHPQQDLEEFCRIMDVPYNSVLRCLRKLRETFHKEV